MGSRRMKRCPAATSLKLVCLKLTTCWESDSLRRPSMLDPTGRPHRQPTLAVCAVAICALSSSAIARLLALHFNPPTLQPFTSEGWWTALSSLGAKQDLVESPLAQRKFVCRELRRRVHDLRPSTQPSSLSMPGSGSCYSSRPRYRSAPCS